MIWKFLTDTALEIVKAIARETKTLLQWALGGAIVGALVVGGVGFWLVGMEGLGIGALIGTGVGAIAGGGIYLWFFTEFHG